MPGNIIKSNGPHVFPRIDSSSHRTPTWPAATSCQTWQVSTSAHSLTLRWFAWLLAMSTDVAL